MNARLDEAISMIAEITERAKAMKLGLVAYPVENIETILEALAPPTPDAERAGEPDGWMHPTTGWVAKDWDAVRVHCLIDGPQPIALYAHSPGAVTEAMVERLREAVKPFSSTADQLDRELPHARNGKVTFVHPLDGTLPKLDGKTDEECPSWPLPDDLPILHAWRYHDPLPASERIILQMEHLRALRAAADALEAALLPTEATKS